MKLALLLFLSSVAVGQTTTPTKPKFPPHPITGQTITFEWIVDNWVELDTPLPDPICVGCIRPTGQYRDTQDGKCHEEKFPEHQKEGDTFHSATGWWKFDGETWLPLLVGYGGAPSGVEEIPATKQVRKVPNDNCDHTTYKYCDNYGCLPDGSYACANGYCQNNCKVNDGRTVTDYSCPKQGVWILEAATNGKSFCRKVLNP